MYDHEILENTKQTEQDNPCLWFLFYFTPLSTRTWPLHLPLFVEKIDLVLHSFIVTNHRLAQSDIDVKS